MAENRQQRRSNRNGASESNVVSLEGTITAQGIPGQTVPGQDDPALIPPPITRSIPKNIPLRIFGNNSVTMVIDGRTYHIARLTSAGVADVQAFIFERYPPTSLMDGENVGEIIVEGAISTGAWDLLREMMQKVVEEELPANFEFVTQASDMAEAVDLFFEQTGLKWLARMVKNLAKQVQIQREEMITTVSERGREMTHQQALALPIGTDNPSPSTTT